MTEEVDSRLVLAYEESVRAWALQSAVLDELRNRAGILIAAATVSSAFLGAQALGSKRALSAAAILAVVAFGAVILLCVYVLWPAKDWTFVHNGERLIETYCKDDVTTDDMYRQMTIDNSNYRKGNRRRLDWRFFAFRMACVASSAHKGVK
jgi:hypothetical protein